ncbi:MAG: DUF2905 domain-containing protein [Bacillus sp. (in: firmicutes)]
MSSLPKLLMVVGGVIFALGFLMQFIKLGKLPGDIIIKKENATFYFPIVTSIVLSILVSAVLFIIGKFR